MTRDRREPDLEMIKGLAVVTIGTGAVRVEGHDDVQRYGFPAPPGSVQVKLSMKTLAGFFAALAANWPPKISVSASPTAGISLLPVEMTTACEPTMPRDIAMPPEP